MANGDGDVDDDDDDDDDDGDAKSRIVAPQPKNPKTYIDYSQQ
jgi:hypothetical protein